MKMCSKLYKLKFVLFALALITGNVSIAFGAPSVTLTVLNAANEYGEIIVIRGDNVEVELNVVDPISETSAQDIIRLVRVADGVIVNQQIRGKDLSGSRSIGTQKTNGSDVLGKLMVQYISVKTKQVIGTSEQTIFLVDNQAISELTSRTSEVSTKVEELRARADILEQKAEELRARADAADNKIEAARLDQMAMKAEQEAARLERQAIALAAQEAKTAAAAADAKATDAKTKADLADAKATEAKTKADLADAKATEAKTKADLADAKAADAKTKADLADAKAAAADAKAADAKTKADLADARAADAGTNADLADAKAVAADAKAADALTKADTALAGNTDLQNQISQMPAAAQSCPSGQYVTGFDANGNVICDICAATSGPSAVSLLAYYPLDSNVLDATPNHYNGTVGGTTVYAAGYIGQAFSFNGATYVSTGLDIDASVQPQLTMGAWVRPNAGSFYAQVMTHDDQGFDRSIIHYGADWRAYDGGSGGSVHTGLIPASDNWQFVAAVYDQDRQTVMLYVDGNTVMKAGQILGPSVNMFRLGNNQSNSAEFFQGLIDEVFVVSGALNVTELDQIRLNGVRSLFP